MKQDKKQDKKPKQKSSASLMRSSDSKKEMAYAQERIGKGQIKHKVRPGSQVSGGNVLPVGQERIDIAKKMRAEATKDSLQAVSLRKPKPVVKKQKPSTVSSKKK